MAQVRKYSSGGSTARKYGTFTIDGNPYEVDDEFLNQLTFYGKSLDDDTAYQFSKITDALRAGQNLSYDSNADRLDGNVQFDVTDRQNNNLGKRRSALGRFFSGKKENTSRNAIHSLKDFVYVAPNPGGTNYDWSKGIAVQYKKDKDGNFELVDGKKVFINGANNLQVARRLRALKDIAGYTNNDRFTGYNKLGKQAYIDFYNRLGDQGVEDLIKRIEDGSWTDEDKLSLKDIGILLGEEVYNSQNNENSSSSHTNETAEQKVQRQLADNGITNKNAGKYVTTDEDGNLIVTDLFNQTFGNRNAIYNDWWQQYMGKNNLWNPDFSFLKGYTRFGNRLYKTSDFANENSDLYKFARMENGFYDLNAHNKFDEANNIFEYLWGHTDQSSKFDKENLYSSWFNSQSPKLRYRSLTGTRQLPKGQQLIEYWDDQNKDMLGRPSVYKYAVLDSDGNLIADNVDINDYDIIEDGEQTGLTALSRINQPDSPYHGRYIMNFTDPSGNINDYTLYINPDNKNDIILQSEELKRRNATSTGQNIRIPEEFANAINNNPEFWRRLLGNKELQNRFIRSLVEGVRSQFGTGITDIGSGWATTRRLQKSDLEALGFDSNIAEAIDNYLRNYGNRNGQGRYLRRNERLVAPYQPNIPTHQKGGAIGTTKEAIGHNDTKKVDNHVDPQKVAGVRDRWDLSQADKLEIASIIGDVTSLIAAIPTGGNPVAGVLGYGSTLAQFGADVSRDGFQIGDLGNLLLGAGLDTVSLLPGIGISGKAAKTAKAIKKAAPVLRKALIAAGAVSAVPAVNNIISGDYNLDDFKKVSIGLLALKGGIDEYKNIKFTKYKGKAPKVEGKTKDDLKREYVDKIVSDKKLGFHDGQPTRWSNEDGTVKNYQQAIEDLTKSGNLKITKTQEAKWAAEAAKSKSKAKITNTFSGSWNPLSSNYRYRMSNRELPENFDIRSLEGHPSQLRTLGRIIRHNPEIATQLRNEHWILPETFRIGSEHGGSWLYRTPVFKKVSGINWNKPMRIALPEATGVRDIPVTLPGRRSPIEISNIDPYMQQVDDFIGLRFHKKGGKIVKAEPGSQLPSVITDDMADSLKKLREDSINHLSDLNQPPSVIKSSYGHGPLKHRPYDTTNMLLGVGDFITSTVGTNKTSQKMKDAIRKGMIGSQQQKPTEFYSRFSDNGLYRTYGDRIKNMRQYKTVTSDPNQVMAERLMRDMNVDQMENERDTKMSQLIDQYNNNLLAQKQQYSNMRTQITNENKNRWYQGLSQLDMAEASRIGQQAQNVKNLIYQFRTDHAKDTQERLQAQEASKRLQAQRNFEKELDTYRYLFTDEMKEKYDTFIKFMTKEQPDLVSSLKDKYFANIPIDRYNENPSYSWLGRRALERFEEPKQYVPKSNPMKTESYKKGGTIKQISNVTEQAYLDQQKAINKAINDLNNNIIKLFIKMMS